MHDNDYDTVIAHWKVALIRRRAKRMGFRRDELPDVEQQIVLAMNAFRYDPARANGASEKTALTSLVDRQLSTLRRVKLRRERLVTSLEVDHQEIGEHDTHGEGECIVAMTIDVREVVSRLSAQNRSLCEALSLGQSIDEIARNLGCSWHTVKNRIDRLREHFEQVGLDGWIHD